MGLCKLNSVDPQLESARFQPLSLSSDTLVSQFASKVNLYRYKVGHSWDTRAASLVVSEWGEE